MTIACTRCGATCDGDIILPSLAFGFKHEAGCGHGVGPLAVLPGSAKPRKEETIKQKVDPQAEQDIGEIKVEEKVEKPRSRDKKKHRFGQ